MIAFLLEDLKTLIEDLTPDTQRNARDVFQFDYELEAKIANPGKAEHRHFVLVLRSNEQTWEFGDAGIGERFFKAQVELILAHYAGVREKKWLQWEYVGQDMDKIAWKVTQMTPDTRPAEQAYGGLVYRKVLSSNVAEETSGMIIARAAVELAYTRAWS